jgi:hypothetical protein
VCHKALEKAPARRYRTAAAFTEDVRRYINGDPILARPQSVFYRIRKKALNYEAAVLAALAVLAVTSVSAFYWYWSTHEIREKERALAAERAKAEARWILAYQNDFDSGTLDSANWHNVRPNLNPLTYRVENGALVLEKGGRLMSTVPVKGNVRVIFDARVENANEVTVILNCDSTYGNSGLFYRFLWNDDLIVWRKEGLFGLKSGEGLSYNDQYFSRETFTIDWRKHYGEWFRVEVQVEDGVCRAVAAGRDTLVCEDVFSLTSNPRNSRWGFRSIVGRLSIDNLRVYAQTLPERIEVTRMADILVSQGAFGQAQDHLQSVITDYRNPALINSALRKIMAMAEMSQDRGLYLRLLEDPKAYGKIMAVADGHAMEQFLKNAIRSARPGPRLGVLDKALRGYADRFTPEVRFRYYVYLGLAFYRNGTRDLARRFLQDALAVKQDTVVAQYLARGPVPGTLNRRGSMRFIPGGYLPHKYGDVKYVAPFWIDTTEVTQAVYLAVTGANPAYFNGKRDSIDYGEDLARPVERVNLMEAFAFCNQRSKLEGLDTVYRMWNYRDTVFEAKVGRYSVRESLHVSQYKIETVRVKVCDFECDSSKNGYRLATADEFEYAQRGQATTEYFWGNGRDRMGEYAWFQYNAGHASHPVATRRPNAFGLYDMCGNVAEWGFKKKLKHEQIYMFFGGSWQTGPLYLFSGRAIGTYCWYRNKQLGFRCVRSAL